MRISKLLILVAVLVCCLHSANAQENAFERPDWQKFFEEFKATGTIVVADERNKANPVWVFNAARARQGFIPASTYKIPHALIALETGVVRDEFQVFPWDGVQRSIPAHNADQDLRSSMRHSAVWVYQEFAKKIGEEKATRYLKQAGYGNADASGGAEGYWLDGNLRISAHEQIAFLRKLYRNQLPFKREHQRLVKDIMVNEAGYEWILRAKTGFEGQLGWWVGWVEWPTGPVYFALNIETPNRMEDVYKRQAITRAILRSIKALPPEKSAE